MLALPVEFVHGWLFGLDVGRVRPEIRERLTTYRREAFGVLWRAFQPAGTEAPKLPAPTDSPLVHVRNMALAVATMADQQLALEGRLTTTEDRLDRALTRAAAVFGDLGQRLTTVERALAGGLVVTEGQAAEIALAVKALAVFLGERDPSKEWFGAVFSELYRRFGVSSYHNIPAARLPDVLAFLEDWRRRAARAKGSGDQSRLLDS